MEDNLEVGWLTSELKEELKTIMVEYYGKSLDDSEVEDFAINYTQVIDMLDKANLKFELRPVRLVDRGAK